MRSHRIGALAVVVLLMAALWAAPQAVFAAIDCVVTSCDAPTPVCGGSNTTGLNNCGLPCTKTAPANTCVITTAATCSAPASGTRSCTSAPCTSGSALPNTCLIATAATCSAPASGTRSCTSEACTSGDPLTNTCVITTAATCSAPASGTRSCTSAPCTSGSALPNTCLIATAATCSAPASGTRSCTLDSCTSGSALPNNCLITAAATCLAPASGTMSCTSAPCTGDPALSDVCNITTAATCGSPGTGTLSCSSGACTTPKLVCAASWQPYGYVKPGDPVYGFPAVKNAIGANYYADPETKDFLGLAAKGNIVIGNYTSPFFGSLVVPLLDPSSPTGKTRPYAIDPTDTDLGYHTGDDDGIMTDALGRPLFDGNYNQQDMDGALPGEKTDGNPRKFYESTLADTDFQNTLGMPPTGTIMQIDAVLFTNHALAGLSTTGVTLNGAMVSRDDALNYGVQMAIRHDPRMLQDAMASRVVLPMSVRRPQLTTWEECPPEGCP